MLRNTFPRFVTWLMLLRLTIGTNQGVELAAAESVFKLDVPNPTADKPQSKLWYAHNSWWACLPTQHGNELWKRSQTGWAQSGGSESPLRGLFGHADVYSEQDHIYVALVSPHALTVVALCYDRRRDEYVRAAPPIVWPTPANEPMETATLTRDLTGRLWVAYQADQAIWIRASTDRTGICWTEPILIARGTDDDDICAIARLRGGVGVIWSNQNDESIAFRFHCNGRPPQTWQQLEIVAQGDKTADDHLNCAVAADGTLYVATKTSLDTLDRPLLSLRERLPEGKWRSHAYATLTSNGHPSRPIALVSHNEKRLVLCHTLYGRQHSGVHWIVGLVCRYPDPDLRCQGVAIIPPTAGLNNVTGCKSSLPNDVPAVVLASDGEGNVYEAIVDLEL